MSLKKIFGFIVFSLLTYNVSLGQEYIITSSLHLNNRGSGLGFGVREKNKKKVNSVYEFHVMNLKSFKELTISNVGMANSSQEPGTFKYGKINQVLQFRFGYGKEVSLAKRPDKNAIGIIWNSTAGLNLAFQIPVFIDYNTPGQNENGFITVRYDPEVHERPNIIQSHSYYNGLSGSKFIPSLFLKQGLIMEFGNYANSPSRLESGLILDAFPIQPQIMYNQKLPHFFLSFYVSFALLNFEI
ncbi:MAG: hypothetical protein M0R38_04765 [Bacteroidia bacterium]|nr:hypothetical protein [Bacteroidia bacterium]